MIYKKQIKNTSSWETEPLIEIIKRCAEHRGVDLRKRLRKSPRRGDFPFRIKKTSGWSDKTYRGRCYGRNINGDPAKWKSGEIYIGVPDPEKVDGFRKERFARVVIHEIDHLLGLDHREMVHSSELDTPKLDDVQVTEK